MHINRRAHAPALQSRSSLCLSKARPPSSAPPCSRPARAPAPLLWDEPAPCLPCSQSSCCPLTARTLFLPLRRQVCFELIGSATAGVGVLLRVLASVARCWQRGRGG
jgi:hypothetical protein